ncbi:hypothetical protein R1sor_008660 [Riccia sorocarpa]|uniref:Fe2OG dioxygenase domain-containing protein n=1 Tax=Riccia sorocarpa TaxID=122646 RepID=A0ABD3HXH5_9MARC
MATLSVEPPSSMGGYGTREGLLEKQVAGARGNDLGDAMSVLPRGELKRVEQASDPEGHLANAAEVSRLLREGQLKEVPQAFIVPEESRAKEAYNDFSGDQDIPTIDISPAFANDSEAQEHLVEDIARACESTGFLHVVGHGFPEQLMKDAQAHGEKLFALPLDQKLKGSFAHGNKLVKGQRRGYSSTPTLFTPARALVWQEGFTLIGDRSGQVDVDLYAEMLWPHDEKQRQSFCEVYKEYAGHSMRVCLTLKDLLVKALKVDSKHFEQYFEQPTQVLHLTGYPPAPNPLEVMGLNPHYDHGAFTIILQNEVPGLQIRGKSGKWFSIRPVPGAFCFTVADTLQALSNGRFKSYLHRVVVNKEKPRLTISTFLAVDFHKVIEPAPELVDDKHPRLYRSFTYREYLSSIRLKAIDHMSDSGHMLDFVKLDSPDPTSRNQ